MLVSCYNSPVLTATQEGKRTGFVIKDMMLRYRFPVTYPDSVSSARRPTRSRQLIIASKPIEVNQERAQFKLHAAMWSLKENKLVLTADS